MQEETRRTVLQTVLAIAKERKPEISAVKPTDLLNVDLGLRSLDLARVVAKLEIELEQDPFLERVSITSVRTVDDLCRAYTDEGAGPSGASDEVDEAELRAQRRREQMGHGQPRKPGSNTEDPQ